MMLVMIFIALMMFEDGDNNLSNYFEDNKGDDDDSPRS